MTIVLLSFLFLSYICCFLLISVIVILEFWCYRLRIGREYKFIFYYIIVLLCLYLKRKKNSIVFRFILKFPDYSA